MNPPAADSQITAKKSSLRGRTVCETPVPPPSSKGSYIQIFPKADITLDTEEGRRALQFLAERITANVDTPRATHLVPGYTYFGQFIDHDLTWNRVAFDADQLVQIAAPNHRSSFLDLDSLYGEGPPLNCQFEGPEGGESFIIGPTDPSPNLGLDGGRLKDVPFDGVRPVIGDRADLRNAENLIVRQLHVAFLKFHNEVIAQLPGHDGESDLPKEGTLFEKARTLVTWTYQWLVWNDFLFKIRATRARDPEKIAHPNHAYQLPFEFVTAAFRFGHSMIRPEYALNCHHNFVDNTAVPLLHLMNPSQNSAPPLPEEYAIEWRHFFAGITGSGSISPIRASSIDTQLISVLGQMFAGTILAFNEPAIGEESRNLAYRTLLRGAKTGLASGQQVARVLRSQGVFVKDITAALQQDSALQQTGLTDNTPLWYYILKEAEQTEFGDRLGYLGSYIVESTLEGALQNDSQSFLNQRGPKWKPPEWILPKNNRDMAGLISFAKANEVTEGCA